MDLARIQQALRAAKIEGWLLWDFHNRNPFAYRVLGLDPEKSSTRRWFYYLPARGLPRKLVSAVEKQKLDDLPGEHRIYVTWPDLHAALKKLLGRPKKIAMEYSPRGRVPYISVVDAGTLELIKSFGHKVVSSADLLQRFASVLDEEGYRLHKQASVIMDKIMADAFVEIGRAVGSGKTEYDISQYIMGRFSKAGLVTCDPPMVGVNDHPADPHFDLAADNARPFKLGDTVLIDMWAKSREPKGVYYDITWAGYIGDTPPPEYQKIFEIVRDARDAAVAFIQAQLAKKKPCLGWQVDDACRAVIERAGYGKYFVHRTGHSIGQEVHDSGVNMDNFETRDEREILPGCCFSIEPGIYLEGRTAVRLEIDVFIRPDGTAEVTGALQRELVRIG